MSLGRQFRIYQERVKTDHSLVGHLANSMQRLRIVRSVFAMQSLAHSAQRSKAQHTEEEVLPPTRKSACKDHHRHALQDSDTATTCVFTSVPVLVSVLERAYTLEPDNAEDSNAALWKDPGPRMLRYRCEYTRRYYRSQTPLDVRNPLTISTVFINTS